MCSALDVVNNRYYLPNLPFTDSAGVASIRQDLDSNNPGRTFIYPATSSMLNCEGVASAVRFCYSDLSSRINLGTERSVFTLLILEELQSDPASFRVMETVDVRSTPTEQICTQRNTLIVIPLHYCCDTFTLLSQPTAGFVFAITNEKGLLRYESFNPNSIRIQVDHYSVSGSAPLSAVDPYTPSEGDRETSQPLKFFQFLIRKYIGLVSTDLVIATVNAIS